MPIQFSCAGCGNILRVGDEMAGRKGKCPKCGLVNQVPYATGGPPPAPVPTPVPVAPVPYPAMAIAQTPVAPAPMQPPFVNEPMTAGVAEPAARPPRKKAKLLIPLLMGGGVMFMLLVCSSIGYFAYTWFFSAGLSSEQKYFPNGTSMVASVRVDQAMSSDFYKQIKDTLKKGALEGLEDQKFEKNLGVPLSNIDRLTFAVAAGDDTGVTMVRTKKSVKGPDIKSNLGKTFSETTVNGSTIYQNDNDNDQSFCVVEADLVLVGKFKLLKAVVDRGKKPELSEAMQNALKKADFGKTVAFALNIKDVVNAATKDKKSPGPSDQGPFGELVGLLEKSGPPEKQIEKFGRKIESASGSLDVKTDLTLNLQVECKDKLTAEDVRKLTEASLVLLKLFGDDSDAFPKDILDDLTTNMKVSTSGTTTSASGTIKGPPIVAFSKKMNNK
jgi:hypothetical protein